MLSPEMVGFFTIRCLGLVPVVRRTVLYGFKARAFGSGSSLHRMQACNDTTSSTAPIGRRKRL